MANIDQLRYKGVLYDVKEHDPELPAHTVAQANKVLKVDGTGLAVEWSNDIGAAVAAALEGLTYTVTYTLDGGTNPSENPATFSYSDLPIVLEGATKAEFQFEGWFSEVGFTNEVLEISTLGNKALFAKFAVDTSPTTVAVHNAEAKTITYTFSEPIQLITGNDLWPGYPGPVIDAHDATFDLFHIYHLNDDTYAYDDPVLPYAGAEVTEILVNASKKVVRFTYTGTLAAGTYAVDAMGYTITDLAGNEVAASVAGTIHI